MYIKHYENIILAAADVCAGSFFPHLLYQYALIVKYIIQYIGQYTSYTVTNLWHTFFASNTQANHKNGYYKTTQYRLKRHLLKHLLVLSKDPSAEHPTVMTSLLNGGQSLYTPGQGPHLPSRKCELNSDIAELEKYSTIILPYWPF